ncbi:MAG: iron hydrogenase small subunit [Dysgonamonadaceae bacterium]|nr:iron hydrogenase small subunit [Dysgonamonadaceae bacterium]
MENKLTRRKFIKTTAFLGIGMSFLNCETAEVQQRQGRTVSVSSNNPAIQFSRSRCRRNCSGCWDFCQRTTGVYQLPTPSGGDACVQCGQCTLFCENSALTERLQYQQVAREISNPDKIVIATTAPAIRVALGEMYNLSPGTNVEGRIVGALNQLAVNQAIDATFSADLTVMEEASELIQRLETGNNPLPMFTSCCPAWVRFVKLFYPALLPHLSTVKSPLLMQGALVKTYFAEKQGIDPSKIVHIALAPYTAKKGEILLSGMNSAGILYGNPAMRDVDFLLTTRELAYLFNNGRVNFLQAQDAPYSSLMGTGSGAGMIFGNTGGVMEASLRTAYRLLNGENPPAEFFNLRSVRGLDNVLQANIDLGKRRLNVAVVHGIHGAKSFIETIQSGTQRFDFVEVMGCTGGCIGGGGQPNVLRMDATQLRQLRMNALFQHDANKEIRLSYDNPQIRTIYDEFLGEPLSEKSKKLLHTTH